jgi:hypothetical protein
MRSSVDGDEGGALQAVTLSGMVRRGGVLVAGVLLVAGSLGGCGDPEDSTLGDSCPALTGEAPPPALTRVLDLTGLLLVEEQSSDQSSLQVAGVAERVLPEVLEEIRTALLDQGWTILNLDDEGFEAELFAVGPGGEIGGIRLRDSECEGQTTVTVSLTFE